MDLVTGTKRVIVAMTHAVNGKSKVVRQCTLPLPVNLVITELAVIEPSDQGLVLKERAPGVTVEKIIAATEALLIILAISPPQVRRWPKCARWSWAVERQA
jgi:acetate CoA/acetoacetate CoA-transferase beta subunit